VCQQEVKVHTQPGEVVFVQLGRVVGSKLVSSRLSRDSSNLVSVDEGPGGGVGGVLGVSVQSPDERYDKGVMCPTMTQLMPPILSDCRQQSSRWSDLLMHSFLISSFCHVCSSLLFRKMVWKMWSL
jgi:hypothetical protein